MTLLMLLMILTFAFPLEVTTHDQDVFSFYPDNRPCNGFEEALTRYREIVPHIHLSGGVEWGTPHDSSNFLHSGALAGF